VYIYYIKCEDRFQQTNMIQNIGYRCCLIQRDGNMQDTLSRIIHN